jgi:hypothetical protein
MTRPETTDDDRVVETWESAIAGTVFVWQYDRREDRYHQASVGGRSGSRRLHITRDDRKYNQEQVPIENTDLDVFTNGALRFVGAATRDDTLDVRYHFTDSELAEMFNVRDPELFIEGVSDITSELILRRLLALGEDIGTQAQFRVLKDLVTERYPIGGTQKTVREMIEAGEKMGVGSTF